MNTKRIEGGSPAQVVAKQILCRECGRLIEVPSSIVEGQNVRCAYCSRKFPFSEASCVKPHVEGEDEDRATMAIKCAGCRRMIAVPPDVKIGQHILCPHCSTKFSFSLGATMHIPTIDLSFLSKASLTIKCEVCGEYIEVDDNIVIGQHVLCPFCNQKFSYSGEKPESEAPSEEPESESKASEEPKKDVKKGGKEEKKSKIRSLAARYHEKAKDRDWVKSIITRTLVVTGAMVLAIVLSVLYVLYHAEIDTRIELRNGLAEFIRSNHQMMTDRHKQYSALIRNIRNDMWMARGDNARMNRLRRDVSELQCIQGAIDDLENEFAAVAPRLDAMSVDGIKSTQAGLSSRVSKLIAVFREFDLRESKGEQFPELQPQPAEENCSSRELSVQLPCAQPPRQESAPGTPRPAVAEPPRTVVVEKPQPAKPRLQQSERPRVDPSQRLQSQIDRLVKQLKEANYPVDMNLLKGMSLEQQKEVLGEMLYDVKMLKGRNGGR